MVPALKKGIFTLPLFFRRSPGLLLFLLSMSVAVSLFIESLNIDPQGQYNLWISGQLFQFSIDMMVSVTLFFLVPLRMLDEEANRPNSNLWQWGNRKIWPLTIESLRVAAKLLMWSILFILPAFYWYIRYLFVPFVVLLNPKYDSGEIDALEHSSQLSREIAWPLLALFLFIAVAEFSTDYLRNQLSGPSQFFMLVITSLLTLVLSLYSYAVVFELYRQKDALR